MTENDQAFDAIKAAEPRAKPLDRRMVDLTVAGKWGNGRGNETSQIKGFHVNFSNGDTGRIIRGRPMKRVPIACGEPTRRLHISEDSDLAFHSPHRARHFASWKLDTRMPDRDAGRPRNCEICRGRSTPHEFQAGQIRTWFVGRDHMQAPIALISV